MLARAVPVPTRPMRAPTMIGSFFARAALALVPWFVAGLLTLPAAGVGADDSQSDETADPQLADEGDETSDGGGAGSPIRTIVVLGSSTAAGIGPGPGGLGWVERYRAHLQRNYPEFDIVNLATGGQTTFHIQPSDFATPANRPAPDRGRNITHALTFNPVAIIINMPSNDQQGYHPLSEQMANYERVVSIASARGIPTWITTSQPRNFGDPNQLTALLQARDAITSKYGAFSINFWSPFATPRGTIDPKYDSGDGVHMNNAAHELLGWRMAEAKIPQYLIANRR